MPHAVNEFLSIFGHDSVGKRSMTLKFFQYFWRSATDDPRDRAEVERRRDRRREEHAASLERQLQRDEIDRKKKQTEDREFLVMWLLSAECRQMHAQAMARIQDAIEAAHLAHEKALQEVRRADLVLQELQGKAIRLPDGRRVYFTRDGTRLYGDDDQEISDANGLLEARIQMQQKPEAQRYEDFIERRQNRDAAHEKATQIADALKRLEELGKKVESGTLSPEELKTIQHETDNVVQSLPAEARDAYERLQAARNGHGAIAHRDTDVGSDQTADNFRKITAPVKTEAAEDKPAAPLAYKSVSPF
jgi:hypothetical protein